MSAAHEQQVIFTNAFKHNIGEYFRDSPRKPKQNKALFTISKSGQFCKFGEILVGQGHKHRMVSRSLSDIKLLRMIAHHTQKDK